jgi:hypothetical protein
MKRVARIAVRAAKVGCTVIVLISLLPYLSCPVYRFPDPEPFHGEHWYNPYEEPGPEWLKANFHAHIHTWAGLTNGKGTPEELHEVYDRMGYDIIGISNYQDINSNLGYMDNYIPVYEHGYNLKKSHQLVLGAREVVWSDYIYLQTLHMKQHMLRKLQPGSELVVLAHPVLRKGYRPEEVHRLSGYDLMEVYNRNKYSGRLWDQALSAGFPIWALGNDDVHDISSAREVGKAWSMINAKTRESSSVYEALRKGRSYTVKGTLGQSALTLKSLQMQGDTLTIAVNVPASIWFIGQNGLVKKSVDHAVTASLVLDEGDTYIRAEVKDSLTTIILNPVIRFNGINLPVKAAEINRPLTIIYRLLILVFITELVFIRIYLRSGRKRLAGDHL